MARRLAAIVAVDVVGFSRLMAIDEDETWAAWSDLRELIDPILETGGGRIVKSTGDGVLVESPSVIEAVRSAVHVQQVTGEWNDRRPADRALRLRIGINLGDVIIADDGDVYGDGVNVAARLEGLADPGGVCLSDSAYQQIRGRVDARFVDRGEQWVKNIPTPIRVWALLEGEAAQTEVNVGIGGLEHAEVVGRGGNATVYRAYQRSMDRWVAIKVLDGSDEATRRRFDRERQAMGRLSQHPGIVTIYESGYTPDGRPYLVMPFLGAGSLRDRLDRSGPMPWSEAAAIISVVALAVDHAHRAEIVHRDLKPANIMLDDEGRPLVADFGIARLANQSATVTERVALTPAYSPPELLDGAEPTAEGDVYGLAATFCALVTGTPPFTTGSPDTDTLLALSIRIAQEPPPDLRAVGVPEHASSAVEAAMAKDPGRRPSSARAFADALSGEADPRAAPLATPSARQPWLRSSWRWVAAIAGVGVIVAVAALIIGSVTSDGEIVSSPTTTGSMASPSTSAPPPTTTVEAAAAIPGAEWSTAFGSPIVEVHVDHEAICTAGGQCETQAVVVLADGTIDAVDVRTGESVWPDRFEPGAGNARHNVDVAVTDERILLARSDSRLIYSVDIADGSQEWRTVAPFDSAEGRPHIAVADGAVYVGFGLGVGRLDADDAGALVWAEEEATFTLIDSLSVDGRLVLAGDGQWVYGLDADTGASRWRVGPPRIETPVWLLSQELEISSGAGRDFDRRAFIETAAGDLVLIDGDTGAERWSAPIPIEWRPGSAPDDVVFVGGVDRELLALDAESGDELWSNTDLRIDGPPVVSGDTVFVIVGLEIVAVNARSGNERGRVELPGSPTSEILAVGEALLIVVDDVFLAVRPPG